MLAFSPIRQLPIALLIVATMVLTGAGNPKPKQGAHSARIPKAEPLTRRAEPNPVTTIRPLSVLQERIAHGDHEAVKQQIEVAGSIGRQLSSFPPDVWKDARNRIALIKFVFSGGEPMLLRRLVGEGLFEKSEMPLARGALAYALGSRSRAMGHLTAVDPRALDWNLGGHVALIKAVLAGESDPRAGLAYCDEARLLSPGTLVEETSLRLSIDLAATAGDWKLFQRSVMRYLYRFPKSPYAVVVIPRVARVLAANGDSAQDWQSFLSRVAARMPDDRRGPFYAEVADLALRSGRLSAAAYAAQKGSETGSVPPDRATVQRAIEGASMIFGDAREQGLRLLGDVEATAPSAEIRQLIAAARSLNVAITAPPDNSLLNTSRSDAIEDKTDKTKSKGSVRSADKPAPSVPSEYDKLVAKVRTQMTAVDELIERAGS